MLVHLYSDGKTLENHQINFNDAMYLVEHQQTQAEEFENFIGFTAPEHDDAVLQFIRETEELWLIDIPVIKDNKFIGSYVSKADHSKIVAMITNFFIEESVLRQSIVNQNYKQMQNECGSRWGIGFKFTEFEDA